MMRNLWADPNKRRWVGWAALASAFLLVNFHRVSTGVLADTLASVFDTTGAQLGLLHSSFFYIYAPMQLFAGVMLFFATGMNFTGGRPEAPPSASTASRVGRKAVRHTFFEQDHTYGHSSGAKLAAVEGPP